MLPSAAMDTFLDDLAAQLLKSESNDFSNTCIVLPNRRAGVFLRQAISRHSTGAIWAPSIVSIEDFVFGLSEIAKADQTTLLFTFYEVYSKTAMDAQSIEMFASWAPIFLSDINELDLNLLPAEELFKELYSIERIKKWNPADGEATEFQERHLKFVKHFNTFYYRLNQKLREKKIGYQGMAFREVSQNIETIIQASKWKEIWFAGFNALTESEEVLFSAWQKSGRAKMFWDTDAYYTENPNHEAGFYIRKYTNGTQRFKLESNYNWKNSNLFSPEKELNLIAAQRNISQVKIAASILQKRVESGATQLTNTAVVLNDEQLLIPLLSALPVELSQVNITMGYGVKQSQSAIFIQRLFELYSKFAQSGNRFHHSVISSLVNDPFFKAVDAGKTKLPEKPKVFYNVTDFTGSELGKLIFTEQNASVNQFLSNLRHIISAVAQQLDSDKDVLEREFLYLLEKQTQRLIDLTKEFEVLDSINTLHTFWKQLLHNVQLDFVGEPLTGLQVMGMLETRNLDFEEVIMLGVNEGFLPSNSRSPSYFTFDIRKVYGLACQNERDAVTAYHFYRLLQRAKRVHLVYDEDTDSFGGGEVSRYMKQLKMEAPFYSDKREWNINLDIPEAELGTEISIEKGEFEFENLLHRASKSGFSPSALNTFRACSLKYYFRYIARVEEPDEFQEDIDAAKLGSAIHGTLEDVYKPFLNKVLNVDSLKEAKKTFEPILMAKFQEELDTKDSLTGANLLSFQVATNYVLKVLNLDIEAIKSGKVITLLGLELKLKKEMQINSNGENLSVLVSGSADRIDRLSDGTVRVIDYKTGSFAKKFKVGSIEDFQKTDFDNAFQMLMYGYIASHQIQETNIKPVGYYLRSRQIEFPIEVKIDEPLEGEQLLSFSKEAVKTTLENLFDKNLKFTQTEELKTCGFCEFASVCQRG